MQLKQMYRLAEQWAGLSDDERNAIVGMAAHVGTYMASDAKAPRRKRRKKPGPKPKAAASAASDEAEPAKPESLRALKKRLKERREKASESRGPAIPKRKRGASMDEE